MPRRVLLQYKRTLLVAIIAPGNCLVSARQVSPNETIN